MTTNHRIRTAGVVLALAFSTATASASARAFDVNAHGTYVPAGSPSMNAPSQSTTPIIVHDAVAYPAAAHSMASPPSAIASDVAAGRRATVKYRTNLKRAKADGYRIITRMIPDMGYHFMNASVKGFNVRKPPILVYEHHGHSWQLGALEWVFPSKPATPPLPGARYGVFGAACHYVDGTFVYQTSQAKCAATSPRTGAAFNFWHPRLVTLHLWLWYPNPSGLFMGTNPLVAPFDRG